MENNLNRPDTNALLEEQNQLLQTQISLQKKQTIFITILLAALVIGFLFFGFKIVGTLNKVNLAAAEVTALTQQLNKVLEESSLLKLLQNASDLIYLSGESLAKSVDSVNDALEKINSIDFDSLNTAIVDLKKVINPLATLFGR